MANAELGKQRVDRAYLHASPAADIANARRADVILTVRLQERKGGKPLDDLGLRLGPRETLKQFLENEPSRDDYFISLQGIQECLNFRRARLYIPPQRKGPDTRIDEDGHARRERSSL